MHLCTSVVRLKLLDGWLTSKVSCANLILYCLDYLWRVQTQTGDVHPGGFMLCHNLFW